jgi:hypothetical protein
MIQAPYSGLAAGAVSSTGFSLSGTIIDALERVGRALGAVVVQLVEVDAADGQRRSSLQSRHMQIPLC